MKPSDIKFIDETLEKSFNELSDEDPIKKALIRAMQNIKEDCFCGRNVKKKLIPKEFIAKYNINNLWIYNLPSAWRMFYSITPGEEVEVIAVILDWMNHKDYERLFGF